MKGILFPRDCLLLIDGNNLLEQSFTYFLDYTYTAKLYKEKDNNITIPNNIVKHVFSHIITNNYSLFLKNIFNFKAKNKLYCNSCVCFSLNFFNDLHEIYTYTNKKIIVSECNKFIKKIKKHNIIEIMPCLNFLDFKPNIYVKKSVKGEISDTINNINFKISRKI